MYKKSLNKKFVIQKPHCTFSRKNNDKLHKQNIKVIQVSKAAIEIFDHLICLAKWETARFLRKKLCVNMMRTTHNLKKDFQNQKEEYENLKISLSHQQKYFIHSLIVKM